MRKHELQSVVGAVVSGVEASLGVWCKNWTASRGQMSVVGHDSESSLAACQTACARSALEDCSDRGHALAYVLPHTLRSLCSECKVSFDQSLLARLDIRGAAVAAALGRLGA